MSDAGNYGMGEFGHGSLSCRLSFQVPVRSVAAPGRCVPYSRQEKPVTISQVTPSQVRAARGLLGWTLRDLAEASGIHRNTINSFETGRYAGKPETLAAIRKALEKAGVQFLNHKRPGVRMK